MFPRSQQVRSWADSETPNSTVIKVKNRTLELNKWIYQHKLTALNLNIELQVV